MTSIALPICCAILCIGAGFSLLATRPMRVKARDDQIKRRFNSRVQALPQELQDMIFEHVIYCNFDRICVGRDYQPPIALQLNHRLRASFAKKYYRNALVTYMPWAWLKTFLTALSPDHRCMINGVHMRPAGYSSVWDRHYMLQDIRGLMRGGRKKDTCFRRLRSDDPLDWEMVWVRRFMMVQPPAGYWWVEQTLSDFQGKGPLDIVELEVPKGGELVWVLGD